MKVSDLKNQIALLDDDMEILYNEPIIGVLIPMDNWKLEKGIFFQTKDGYWLTEKEFKELTDAGEIFVSEILIKKEQAYLVQDINVDSEFDELPDYSIED